MGVSFTVVADTCEGIGDCVPMCPTECILWADGRPPRIGRTKQGAMPAVTNAKGTRFVYIDAAGCIDCGACLSVCPIAGAILDELQPRFQKPPSPAAAYSRFRPEWRSEAAVGIARGMLDGDAQAGLPVLADALEEAGCADEKLLDYCRRGPTCSGGRWVAELVLASG